MAESSFQTIEDFEKFLLQIKQAGASMSPDVEQRHRDQISNIEKERKGSPIYTVLKQKIGYSDELQDCIITTVDKLTEEGPDAKKPGLLLGKIQSGKTRAFVGIIGLAFDRGFDVCIVLTKGTRALASQTVSRMKEDFKDFKETDELVSRPTIAIYDILNIKNGLTEREILKHKNIIISKKETQNLSHLLEVFEKYSPLLKGKKILIIDDEADFASRNYRRAHGDLTLAKISDQIEQLLSLPNYCRYLQVTATPYMLYLQPDNTIELKEGKATPFKPRFTALVPVFDSYVGGKEYFVDSLNEQSMYSHLFHEVSEKCMKVMGEKNRTYLNHIESSRNIEDFRHAILSYFIATSIRKIQAKRENKDYLSSCLIHIEIAKKNHAWQEDLITTLIEKLRDRFLEGDVDLIEHLFVEIYKDFAISNQKGRAEGLITVDMPSEKEVKNELIKILKEKDYIAKIVNSDKEVSSLLNDNGQLKLTHTMNIFIGGSILDRGITIDRMLCFFYGRNPQKFQQDTVLQHLRMYGNRAKADMAVTRLYTTERIYGVLRKMDDFDNQLREWFVHHIEDEKQDPSAVFVAYEPGSKIKPCSSQRLIVSNTLVLKPHLRLLPTGFQTGPSSKIERTVNEIDSILMHTPGYSTKEFFEITKERAVDIIKKIRDTYIYDREIDDNKDYLWDISDMLGCIEYCTVKSKGILHCLVRTNRELSRIRENGQFSTAPDDGRTDLAPAKDKAYERPVIMFIKQNGNKDQGWRDAPFYWPVFIAQKNISPVIFTLNAPKTIDSDDFVLQEDILKGYNEKEVLKLTLISEIFEEFAERVNNVETRVITPTTASKYLVKDEESGDYKINQKVVTNSELVSNIHSYNNGKFPFLIRPYKYILFTNSRDGRGDYLLVHLNEKRPYKLESTELDEKDILVNKLNQEEEFVDTNYVEWMIIFEFDRIEKIIRQNNEEND